MTEEDAGRTDCPPWCSQDHREDVPGDPEPHSVEGLWVPVTLLRRVRTASQWALDMTAAELIVGVAQPVESPEPWLTVVEAENASVGLELSIGSARRLVRAMTAQLASL
ncbi:hypothetical protein GCM10009788_58870 [Nocardioides humi]|uniref:Uncharacterized protein n=1 Tax=Nocardioides humi TaxID=449461 RepID=A0ABN2C1S8_9ACTN